MKTDKKRIDLISLKVCRKNQLNMKTGVLPILKVHLKLLKVF